MSLLYLCHKLYWTYFECTIEFSCVEGREKEEVGEDEKDQTGFSGCELLESRAVMGITGGDTERSLLGRTGTLRSACYFYADREDKSTGWLNHWTKQH